MTESEVPQGNPTMADSQDWSSPKVSGNQADTPHPLYRVLHLPDHNLWQIYKLREVHKDGTSTYGRWPDRKIGINWYKTKAAAEEQVSDLVKNGGGLK